MILRENHDINRLYSQSLQKPSEVLGINNMHPERLQVPPHCCQKCGNCPEESEEAVKKTPEERDNGPYNQEVPTTIRGLQHLYDLVDAQKAQIIYDIEIDYASWGINGIAIQPHGEIEVTVECTKYGEGNVQDHVVSKTFKVDLDKLKIFYDAAEIIAPKELELYIGPDHEILYARSSLTFHYLSIKT